MATDLSLYADVFDLENNAVIAHSTTLGAYRRSRKADSAGSGSIFANAGTAVCNALVDASGGPDGTGPIKSYALRVSEDGGATYDYRTVVCRPQRQLTPPYGVSEDGQDYATLLSLTGEDRVTWFATTLYDILTNPGTDGRPKGLLLNGVGKTGQAGAAETALAPSIGHAVANVRLNVDVWADYLSSALTQICARVGGTYIAGSTLPLGHFGHWHYDPRTKQIQIGKAPTVPHVTFSPADPGALTNLDEEATIARYIADGLVIDPHLDEMFSQAEFIGGSSDHGMPSGGKVTAHLVINTDPKRDRGQWDQCLHIVGISATGDAGGVFIQPHTGALVSISQPMDVRALAYDTSTGTALLYAFTAHGVFVVAADSASLTAGLTWARVGGLTAPCVGGTVDGGVIIAHVGGSQGTTKQASGAGVDGLYMWPAIGGTATGKGYDGWSVLYPGTVTAFAYRASSDMLLTVDKNKPDTVIRKLPSISTIKGTPITQSGSTPPSITNLTLDAGGCYVVTEAGSDALFYLPDGGTTLLGANQGNTLGLVAVNAIKPVSGVTLKYKADDGTIRSTVPAAVALTGAGLFACTTPGGGQWVELTKNTGLAGANITLFCVGMPQTVLGRQMLRVYAANDSSLFISCNEGRDWQDFLAAPLDMGPFWGALAIKCGAGTYADNDVGALGNVAGISTAGQAVGSIVQVQQLPGGGFTRGAIPRDPSSPSGTGGTGRTLPIPATLTGYGLLPASWIWARRLDKLNQFTYRLVNLVSQAPRGGIRFEALSQITADSATPVIKASENIGVVAFFWLAQASTPQTTITIQGQYHTQEAALRTLNSGDLAWVNGALTVDSTVTGVSGDGVPTTLMSYTNRPFWVLEHTAEMAGTSTMYTTTRLGTRLGEQAVDPGDIADALAYDAGRARRYAGHFKAA